jgi:hypothetical protein
MIGKAGKLGCFAESELVWEVVSVSFDERKDNRQFNTHPLSDRRRS